MGYRAVLDASGGALAQQAEADAVRLAVLGFLQAHPARHRAGLSYTTLVDTTRGRVAYGGT